MCLIIFLKQRSVGKVFQRIFKNTSRILVRVRGDFTVEHLIFHGTQRNQSLTKHTIRTGCWDGRWNMNEGGKSEEPNCRLTQPIYVCSLCGDKTPEDQTGFLKYFVIFNHALAFIAPICMLWTICGRFDSLRKRIYSPFLLMATAGIWEGTNESI